ncbi:GTPase [Candidatus Woesearchaeota archaeon CG11_big_fil_rev_8_21_14_0_20_43_8]|nr:MAG: GTPase [Candidatus Woesearchaeota archaeon CG11_big_fil_rev_8_21_14_0_20_43_8]
MAKKVLIMGAAGRDFHNFNTCFRDNDKYEVVAFTATQIPNIDGRMYPAALAGKLYPKGIPIKPEDELEELISKHKVDEVVFAYSDVPYEYVMSRSSRVNAAGADFRLIGAKDTMIKSKKPVIAICAIRTGCGKSQTTRRVSEILKAMGKKIAVIRHPMPYGDLVKQEVQRFDTLEDLKKHECTIEEMEEYEPHIVNGSVVFAGVDYEKILREAEKIADVILWDGGNNDMSFYKPDLQITVFDPHRVGHETAYYPGEVNARLCDVAVINKEDSADPKAVEQVRKNIRALSPDAIIIDADSALKVEDESLIKGKKVLVVEDGPTLTHGGMKIGAGVVAAKRAGASVLVDPRPFCVGEIKETFEKYPAIGTLLPAMGYGDQQIADLQETINKVDCDAVVIGTPINLTRFVDIKKPSTRVFYDLKEKSSPGLKEIIEKKFR